LHAPCARTDILVLTIQILVVVGASVGCQFEFCGNWLVNLAFPQ
jgi:hypothetical protein